MTNNCEQKAEELLFKYLSEVQRQQYISQHRILVKSKSGRTYIIPKKAGPRSPGGLRNVVLVFEGEERRFREVWCVGLPFIAGEGALNLLALKLSIENDEREVRRKANKHDFSSDNYVRTEAHGILAALEAMEGLVR